MSEKLSGSEKVQDTEKMYAIGEVSKMFRLPASTLRYYEEEGILTDVPQVSGKRFYSECHIHRLGAICCFKRAGMSIAQLKEFFWLDEHETEQISEILSLLSAQENHLKEQIEQLQNDYIHIQKKLQYYSDVKKAIDSGLQRPEWKDYS